MKRTYLDLISIIDQLHRRFLDLVAIELDRLRIMEINSVQAILLFNIGTADMTVSELMLRGCYLGSNVSYNAKKLAEMGYLIQRRAAEDRRTVRVRLSPKGLALCARIDAMHERHLAELASALANGAPADAAPTNATPVETTLTTLRRFDRFWSRMVDEGPRGRAIADRAA
ncbi:hypothetical protein GCM10011611_39100 [Aliidongia dinghuensis]|uniref:HTH marR-type domain-containing protein n=1 Tax=Aliidongia dinghuensis TaxID=1867774 RepID=A0A8J2YVU1_9PROT|nr:winged helix DNA-binding protein [Aliidongia dinghuensis]GGF29255.1 hypothetical protein GCM10011611_39100 [Aliidongia dinghuensis]